MNTLRHRAIFQQKCLPPQVSVRPRCVATQVMSSPGKAAEGAHGVRREWLGMDFTTTGTKDAKMQSLDERGTLWIAFVPFVIVVVQTEPLPNRHIIPLAMLPAR